MVSYFASIQRALLRRAISEAEGAIGTTAGLESVLKAAAQKRQRRTESAAGERAVLKTRMQSLLTAAEQVLGETGTAVRDQVTGIEVRPIERARTPQERVWFREQLIRLGREHGYWVDLSEYRDWVRLQLRDGGVTDIVVACHLIGNPSPGAGVAVVFVQHRDHKERAGTTAPMSVAADPLLLSAEEDEHTQRHRFLDWLGQARNTALAQWTKFL